MKEMKKKLLFLVMIIVLGAAISCSKKKEEVEKKDDTVTSGITTDINTTGKIDTNIFNSLNPNGGNSNIKNLTQEEQQHLINNQIDPAKVSEAITKAEGGDKEAILSLAQLYYNLKDNEKTKKFLQMGVNKNYPEAIYNLAVLLKQEGNDAEANKLMAKLPRNAATTSRQLRPGAQAYNNGIDLIKAKRYNEAKVQFQNAYKQGIKEADIKIALLNKETKNYNEAVKWFKTALARGVTEANFEIGAILYDTGKAKEARPYLIKAYNSGNKALAMPIAYSYHKENNMTEALKWYKTAAKNGNKEAKETIAQIESGKTKSVTSTTPSTILGDSSKLGSLTDNAIAQVKDSNKKATNSGNSKSLNIGTSGTTSNSGSTSSTETQTVNNYNVDLNKPRKTNTTAANSSNNIKTTEQSVPKTEKKEVQVATNSTTSSSKSAAEKEKEKEAKKAAEQEKALQKRTDKAIEEAVKRAQKRNK